VFEGVRKLVQKNPDLYYFIMIDTVIKIILNVRIYCPLMDVICITEKLGFVFNYCGYDFYLLVSKIFSMYKFKIDNDS